MSPTGIHFGCPPTPVTTELWGKREGEKTHWEGEEKTNVFCILLPWLAQAYAWNRCSVNTWGMYVQMNEKRELASRHLGREKKTRESWQIFPEYASTTSLYLPLHRLHSIPFKPLSRYPDRVSHFGFRAIKSLSCGHKTFYCWSQMLLKVYPDKNLPVCVRFLLVLRSSMVSDDRSTSQHPFFISHM